ncbi:MAG: hypothetical protein ACR2QF_02925 [Geminicoccaceae bacterium]
MKPDILKLHPTLRKRRFSSAFWRFVRHEKDIRGLIAYGLYKFHKIYHIRHHEILDRHDTRLDDFDPTPDTIDSFNERAGQFLTEINVAISTGAVASAQSDQLNRIERQVKQSFWPNVRSSFWGSVAFAATVACLPLGLWLLNPDFRQSIETGTVRLVAGLVNQRGEAIDALIDDLEDQQRRRFLVKMLDRVVAEAPEPMVVLQTVLDEFDQRSINDRVVKEIVAVALKRARDPDQLLQTIFWQELQRIESAAPPIDGGSIER